MEDLYGARAYEEGYGPHRSEDFASQAGKAAAEEVNVEYVKPADAVGQSMELHG